MLLYSSNYPIKLDSASPEKQNGQWLHKFVANNALELVLVVQSVLV